MFIIKVVRPAKPFTEKGLDKVVDERLSETPDLSDNLKRKGWKKLSHRKAIKGKDYDTIKFEEKNEQ